MSKWPGNAHKESTTFGGLSRSQLMSRIRSKGNRTTEQRLATLLRKACLTGWRRHRPVLGNPDFVWPKARVAVFVDGCFWHGHECGKNISPRTNVEAWRDKIRRNRARDQRVGRSLRQQGWRVVRIWECTLAQRPESCIRRIRRALDNQVSTMYIRNLL